MRGPAGEIHAPQFPMQTLRANGGEAALQFLIE